MKALIKVGYGCNDHCAFCHTLDVRHLDGEDAEVRAKIHRAKALGYQMIVLSGGEPTIRPELVSWAELSASLDLDFGLVTNGRMLAYPELVDTLLGHRLAYVYLSLHGGSARVHDLMVRSKAFTETYGSLANLSGRGIDLHVNCVVTKQNLAHLRGVVDAMRAYPDAQLKFSMVEPKGGGDKLFARLMPRVREVATAVADAIGYGDSLGMRVAHGALPFCLLPGLEDRYDDLKTHRFAAMVEIGEPDFFPVDDKNKVQPEPCDGCALRGSCPGLYRGYHEAFGHEELMAVSAGARSNSFDYVFDSHVTTRGECPLRDGDQGVTPWDRGRHLFVRHGDRVARFVATSRDFSDVEMAEVKQELGQVYYDVSQKAAPDDFARDLVKLKRAAMCDSCAHEPECTGMHEPVMEDVFGRDDARLRERLRALRGDVLDIGCGESPYAEELAEAAEAGTLRYVGVDPDAPRIASLRAAMPWAELHVADVDALGVLGARRFDHVLVLRSWNHLPDPLRAARRLASLVRPGGSLTVVDNVAFGLARTPAQTRRAQRGPARFEHHRNDGVAEARRCFEGLGMHETAREDVGMATSNQWMLMLRAV